MGQRHARHETVVAGDRPAADLAARVAALDPVRRALLEHAREGHAARAEGPDRTAGPGEAVASFGQERMWLLAELQPDSVAYNYVAAVALRGPLHPRSLRSCLDRAVADHEALRTVLTASGGQVRQRVLPPTAVSCRLVDLAGLDARAAARGQDALLRREAARPFDLAREPMLRCTVVRHGPAEHVFVLAMHHAAMDRWSLGVLAGDLAAHSRDLRAGRPRTAPVPAARYRDFAAWQRALLDGPERAALERFWAAALDGLPASRVPPDFARDGASRSLGRTVVRPLSRRLARGLRARARRERCSVFMLVTAATATLLRRLTGQPDVALATLAAGRTRREYERVVGYFVNPLLLRLRGDGEAGGVAAALAEVRAATVAATAHQELPFELVLEQLRLPRGGAGGIPVGVLCVAHGAPPALDLPGVDAESLDVELGTAQFDVVVETREREGALELALSYDLDLYEPATITAVADALVALLGELASDGASGAGPATAPRRPAPHSVELLPTLDACFERQADRTPERVALVDGAGALTYRALDRRANRLARALRARGVQPGDRVAVCLPRGHGAVAALLAVAKAGAAFLPLDPGHPQGRIASLLADASPAALVTAPDAAGAVLGAGYPGPVVDLAGDAEEIAAHPAARLGLPGCALAPAYLIHTSASTGAPKGVLGTHAGAVNRLRWMWEAYPFLPGELCCHRTPLSFVDSVSEIFGPLLRGVPAVVVGAEEAAEPARLVRRLAAARVTRLLVVPSLLRAVLALDGDLDRDLRALRLWVTSGERLPQDLAGAFHDRLPGRTLLNLYGSSEVAADATAAVVGPGEARRARAVAIGAAITGVHTAVLDDRHAPQPPLVPGELYVGGAGVALGYHGHPAETARRFLPDPHAPWPGARWFRTGDVVRARAGGALEFLDRADDQVQLRGQRVELGEVEAALARRPDVAAAAVGVRDDPHAGAVLVAYVVPAAGGFDRRAAHAHVRRTLPPVMAPAGYVTLEHMPLTPSGKVDRGRLPAPGDEAWLGAGSSAPPRTSTERAVAQAFSEVLPGGRAPGVHDDFFLLGGHSLVAAEVVRRLRERCEVELGLPDVFRAPTVAQLAAVVDERARTRQPVLSPEPDPARRAEPFGLTEVQQAYLAGRDPDLPLGGVATHAYTEMEIGGLDHGRLTHALRRVVERHAMLRAVVLPDTTQRVLEEVPPYEIAIMDLSSASSARVEAGLASVRAELTHQVLPAGEWPLFDVRVTRLPADRWRLHVSIDALVCDAYSFGVLMRDLAAFYRDPDLALPAVEITFRDCVLARERFRETPAYARSLEYWRERARDLPPGPELPEAPAVTGREAPRFARLAGRLEPRRWQRLRDHAAEAGVTPSTALLTAFAEVLAAWARRPRFSLTLTVFDRPFAHPHIHEVVGDFTSLTLLDVDCRAQATFAARARRLQERLWSDLEHRAVSAVTVLRERARDSGGPPRLLAPVVFTSNLGVGEGPAGGTGGPLLGEVVGGITQTPQVLLDHQVATDGDALVFNWDAVAARFPGGMLDDAFAAYVALLHRLAHDPAAWERDAGVPIPPRQAEQRARVNATASRLPGGTLHERVAATARRWPRNLAVAGHARRLTYEELLARAHRVAWRLREGGTTPGTLVGVALPKGWEQPVAVLGALAAGAAYLPLDPALPPARLATLAGEARVETVLTRDDLRGRLGGLGDRTQLAVDADTEWAGMPETPPPPLAGPSALAYVIYTSGSTGTPKGVMIHHAGARNTVDAVNRAHGVGPADRTLAVSSLGFDLSVYDLFGPLFTGGAVVEPHPERERDPSHWADLVRGDGVSVWNSVPALMGLLADHAGARPDDPLASLRLVLLSGDWVPLDLPGRVRSLTGGARVVALGGATEASIWSVWHDTAEPVAGWPSVPYGVPMPNQRLHVLDHLMRPRPDWVPGELYIAGDGLARGYWADAERTAERFPRHRASGERLYRTGDVARYRPGGVLEFLGREDLQVKVSGHRVELAEVEHALAGLDAVAACAVVATGAAGGDRRLLAYVVPAGEQAPTPAALRLALGDVLPAYMIPSTFVTVDALPLTGNGKVDREALERASARPGASRGAPAAAPPAGEVAAMAARLCRLWEDVLGVDEVRPDDDFFQLGGTSLVAIRLVARLQERFGVSLQMPRLYETPTPAALARAIAGEARGTDPARGPMPVGDPGAAGEPFPLTDVQHAYWLGRRAGLSLGDVATHAYAEVDVADLDVTRLEAALDRLVERHDALRIVVGRDGLQRVLPQAPPYRVAFTDLRAAAPAAAEAALLVTRERMSHQVFDPEQWPMFEVTAQRLDDRWTRLHVGVDLLVADAHSLQILRGELLATYRDPGAALPPLECTFRDYVLAMRRARTAPRALAARRYWQERAAALPPSAPLPLARHPRELERPRFSRLQVELPPEDWARLRALAAASALTPSGLLCAAFAEVLALWSQCRRFALNVTTFNRPPVHPQIDRVVGDFTSTTLLEVDLSAATFLDRARAVQVQLWRDLEHASVSGIEVLRWLRQDPRRRDAAMMPIVFTSTLDTGAGTTSAPVWESRDVYAVSQTPQVLLDHQVGERGGALVATWDVVAEAFPRGLVPAMFDAYGRLLERLALEETPKTAAAGRDRQQRRDL